MEKSKFQKAIELDARLQHANENIAKIKTVIDLINEKKEAAKSIDREVNYLNVDIKYIGNHGTQHVVILPIDIVVQMIKLGCDHYTDKAFLINKEIDEL